MADVITRFKLETTQYDSKLRDEAKRLAEFTRQCSMAGNEFGKFAQKNVEAARALGNITPSATNAKDKVKELVGAFNDWAKAYNALTKEQQQSDFGKAMSESLSKLKVQIAEAKQELYSMGDAMKKAGGGGLFSGLVDKMSGSLQVFAGNMYTKAAGAVANLGSEMLESIHQGAELAKQGEGIRIAFERIGRGDILDGLRQATHGTVTDLELMKAAVKFNDFKLPVEELGTMLAFAQQKAKDTGQSVDYMVESITNGLGRQSKPILDNLGISAKEIEERIKSTGDFTKAVSEIIREQMAKAGDYVETAADRAAQANVNLQNKMEELGRKFVPVEEASNQLWTSMKIGILDIVGEPLARLLNGLTEAGRLKNALNDINGDGGETRSSRRLRILREYSGSQTGVTKQTVYNRQIARYTAEEEKEWRKVNELTRRRQDILKELGNINPRKDEKGVQASFLNAQANSLLSQINDAKNHAKAIQLSRLEYEKGAKQLLNPSTSPLSGTTTPTTTTPKGKAEIEAAIGSIDYQTQKVQELQKAWRAAADDNARAEIKAQLDEANDVLSKMQGSASAEGSIDWQAKKVQELQKAWRAAADDKSREEINKQIKEANEKLDEMQGKIKAPVGSLKDLKTKMAELQASRELLTSTTEIDAVDAKLKEIEAQIDKLNGKPLQLVTTESKTELEILEAKLAEVNAFIEKYGANSEEGKAARGEQKDLQNRVAGMRGEKTQMGEIQKLTGAVGGILSGVESLGIEIPKGMKEVMSGINGIISIITSINVILEFMKTIDTFSSLPLMKTGGIVHAAGGYRVPGNDFSDHTPVMVSSGELILNRAQQGIIASQLEESRQSNTTNIVGRIAGEDIILSANNYLRRTGKGELVTWKS